MQRKVAHGLTESRIICNVEDRDAYLYYLLVKFTGRTLVSMHFVSFSVLGYNRLFPGFREQHILHEATDGDHVSSRIATYRSTRSHAAASTSPQLGKVCLDFIVHWISVFIVPTLDFRTDHRNSLNE